MTSLLLHGHMTDFNSFTLTNRHIAAGLRALGYHVTETDLCTLSDLRLSEHPDVYIYHSYPYDGTSAPGKLNIFYLAYEYLQFQEADRHLISRLNHFFDLMIVPSHFVRRACEASGVTIPIEVSLEAYSPDEFGLNVPPASVPTNKRFRFLFLGGGIKRKGIDVLLNAYCAEFTRDEDVALVIKSFSYERTLDWVRDLLAEAQADPHTPEIVFIHDTEESVAGYYTAADVGVFPYRGEGFGLPILECIASGRRVIVTRGGSTDDFCTDENAWFIDAAPAQDEDLHYLEPNVAQLRRLMRAAYEAKTLSFEQRQQIAASVSHLTWQNTSHRLDEVIRQYVHKPAPTVMSQSELDIASVMYGAGMPARDAFMQDLRGILAQHDPFAVQLGYSDPKLARPTRLLIGSAGDAFEHLAANRSMNPAAKFILLHDGPPARLLQDAELRERAVCGAPPPAPLRYSSLVLWRHEQEIRMADQIITFDKQAAAYFQGNAAVRVLPPILVPHPQRSRRQREKVRVLFIATDAFRQGAPLLFEAWNQIRPRSAELICLVEHLAVLGSPQLVKLVVKNPSIKVLPLKPRQDYCSFFEETDFVAAPSLFDRVYGPAASSIAYGRCAVISRTSGMSDYLTHGKDAYIVDPGSVDALSEALGTLLDNPHVIDSLSEASCETAYALSAERFAVELIPLLSRIEGNSST